MVNGSRYDKTPEFCKRGASALTKQLPLAQQFSPAFFFQFLFLLSKPTILKRSKYSIALLSVPRETHQESQLAHCTPPPPPVCCFGSHTHSSKNVTTTRSRTPNRRHNRPPNLRRQMGRPQKNKLHRQKRPTSSLGSHGTKNPQQIRRRHCSHGHDPAAPIAPTLDNPSPAIPTPRGRHHSRMARRHRKLRRSASRRRSAGITRRDGLRG